MITKLKLIACYIILFYPCPDFSVRFSLADSLNWGGLFEADRLFFNPISICSFVSRGFTFTPVDTFSSFAERFYIEAMSHSHQHFVAGLLDVLDRKSKLFSWTCPVTPLDNNLSVVITRYLVLLLNFSQSIQTCSSFFLYF